MLNINIVAQRAVDVCGIVLIELGILEYYDDNDIR